MSINNNQKFKDKIRKGQVCVGSVITFSDPAVSELFAEAGYDFTWIDMEHHPIDLQTALTHVMAVRGTDTAPFIRVQSNDPVTIKPVLELEPAGIIVPQIRTAEDVALAVQACKYPPAGIRGYGPRRGIKFGGVEIGTYLQDADERIMVFVQIEHIDAVNNLDAILATPGLDGICLGLNDLSGSMGLLGQPTHPDVVKAVDTTIEKVSKTALFLGLATGYHAETVRSWIAKGIQWICLNGDHVNMYLYSKMVIDEVRVLRE
jgi:2-dehydro-3-deoxyglucarate aldolase/4-hydroxy-2-oxoheptanedioate aldolase